MDKGRKRKMNVFPAGSDPVCTLSQNPTCDAPQSSSVPCVTSHARHLVIYHKALGLRETRCKKIQKRFPPFVHRSKFIMSAILSFESTIFVLLLLVCTATYLRQYRPSLFHRDSVELHKKFLYKCSVVGDRMSPWVAFGCLVMAIRVLFAY